VRVRKTSAQKQLRFIDLFAGIGGTRLGFEAAGARCVLTCEWDDYARRTYEARFGSDESHPFHGDITTLGLDSIPGHDILVAGFPCQPFSIAGVSKKNALGRPHGFDCVTQGTLFFEIERILAEHRPAAFLLENVKNLRGHDGGRTFDVIMRTLTDKLGYRVFPRVVDARSVVPQHRERIYLVGFRELEGEFDWARVLERLGSPESGPRLRSVLHPEDGSELPQEPYTDESGRVAKRYTLSDNLWRYLQDYAAKHRKKGNGFGFGLVGPDDVTRTLSARYYKDGSEILVKQRRRNPRRLTPRECARLMGFPDDFLIPVSDTRAYKQFGNSVVVPVIEAIASVMLKHLERHAREPDQIGLELEAVPA
jgi:DNA (cytosine-5)-methyltransferase 1